MTISESPILSIAVPSPLWQLFDYLPSVNVDVSHLRPGIRIRVPFGRRDVVGLLMEVKKIPDLPRHQLKTIHEVLDQEPLLNRTQLSFYQWASDYYHHPIGDVMLGVLPKLLRQGKSLVDFKMKPLAITENTSMPSIALNTAQRTAITTIQQQKSFQTFLLSGVTGSGKTEVYLQCIEEILSRQQQALVLVPEIALTPQTVERFSKRFSVPIVLLHSNLSDNARLQAWLQAKTGEAKIVIGTRSAIFTPMPQLGIIILDEEHDASFKQQSGFRYSARDLAIRYGQMLNIPVILGSATPSLESFYNAEQGRYQLLSLPARVGEAKMPAIRTIDIRKKPLVAGLSEELLLGMENHLARGHQGLLFLNRRGYATTLLCHHCGWIMQCRHCDARLTLHQFPKRLYCHHCGYSCRVPTTCPECRQTELMDIGLGTEQLESLLTERYPQYQIVRIDRDSTRKKDSMKNKLQSIHDKEAQILIGTQMLAKGHHFSHLTFVAIVDADGGLFGADFRSLERMGQLLLQVAGRAGRENAGEVVVQTHHPENPLLQLLITGHYEKFASTLLAERKTTALPPYFHLALLRAEAIKAQAPKDFLQTIKDEMKKENLPAIQLLGPVASSMEKKAGRYRYQLLLQTQKRSELHQLLKKLTSYLVKQIKNTKVRWSIDVDPQEVA